MDQRDGNFAQVEILPAGYADKILSARSVGIVRNLNLAGPLLLVGGMGLMFWAAFLHRTSIDESDPAKFRSAVILYSLGAGLMLIPALLPNPNKWLRRVARQEISRRPDKVVDSHAPGVRFVEVVPKSSWLDTTLAENATDVGLLAIDLQNRFLFFEGDNERYRVPAQAIVKCEQDAYTRLVPSRYSRRAGNDLIYYHFVVVTMKISEQKTVEMPFRIRTDSTPANDQKWRDANYELLKEINHLKATGTSHRPPISD